MRWSRPLHVLCILGITCATTTLVAASPINLSQLSEHYQSDLFSITSDKEAMHVFTTKLQSALHLPVKKPQHSKNSFRKLSPAEIQDDVITLMNNLLTSRLAVMIQTTVQQNNSPNNQSFIDQNIPGYQWAQDNALSPSMTQVFLFNKNLSGFLTVLPARLKRPPHFDEFAQYTDQHYPELTGSLESWLGLLQQGNIANIQARLSKYWEQNSLQNKQAIAASEKPDQTSMDSYAQYYSWTRLWPIYKSHLIALTIQANSEALQFAQESLNAINHIQKNQSETQKTRRICGTWHWTVHNHQNHGDHKMTLVLGQSTKHPTKQPQPTKIIIKGDTVYLYWKFPRGYQEDSLLLSNNDKRLEGTFMNTLGPYGSITGKRIKLCKRP